MAQISFSFRGGFWPSSLPLFHGFARPSAFVAVSMNGSIVVTKELHVDLGRRALVDPEPSSVHSVWVPESSHWPIGFSVITPTADHWNEERSDVPRLAQVFAGVAAARQAGG
jgi:hypothetical protein